MAKRGAHNLYDVSLSREENEVLMEIDQVIPHFVWCRLKAEILSIPWNDVSSACRDNSPNHEIEASNLFDQLLAKIDYFIQSEKRYSNSKQDKLHSTSAANITSMTVDRNKIVSKYDQDRIGFAHAMARVQELAEYLECLGSPLSPLSPSGKSSHQTNDEAMEEVFPPEGKLKIDERGTSSSPPPLVQQHTQITNDQVMETQEEEFHDMEALENLLTITRDEVIRFNGCNDKIKRLASGVFPKEKSPHEKMTLEELSPASIDHDEFNQTVELQNQALETVNSNFEDIERLVQKCCGMLKKKIDEWRKSEVHSNVRIAPEQTLNDCIFARFTSVLNTLSTWFGHVNQVTMSVDTDTDLLRELCTTDPLGVVKNFEPKLLSFEKEFIQSCLIVSLQPPQTRTLENSKKNSSIPKQPESTGTEKKKKAAEKAFGSKKQQGYDTKIRLPGGENFSSISFKNALITCISEADLSQAKATGTPVTPPAENNLRWSETKQSEVECPGRSAEKEFLDVRISDHFRENKLRNHEEFVRICYFVTVEVNGREYEVQILSLPFHFITGSNQLLSCLGSRLWYFGSSEDLYNGHFKVTDKLTVDKVLELLDKRIRYVHVNGRHLRNEEREMLRDFLPVENGLVSLNNFVKEEVVPKRKSKYTFYVWFHAVINTIETKWLAPWLDGAIYGLVDKEFCDDKLNECSKGNKRSAPIGTVILRPGKSMIEKPNSQSPELALIAQVKHREKKPDTGNTKVVINCVPLTSEHIKLNGLYHAVETIKDEWTRQKVTAFLLGYNFNQRIDYLKRYDEKKDQFNDDYNTIMTKFVHTYITSSSGSQMEQDQSKKQSSKKARKSHPKSKSASSSTQAWSSFEEDAESPPQGGMSDNTEVGVSPGPSDVKMQAFPQSSSQGFRRQQSIKHSIVTSTSMNGGVAVKAGSACSSPVPAEKHNYEFFNGVPIDTTALRRGIQKEQLVSSNHNGDISALNAFSIASASQGFHTMSPASELSTNFPRTHPMPLFAVVKQECPTFNPESGHQVSIQGMPAVSCNRSLFNGSESGSTADEVCIVNTAGTIFQASVPSSCVPLPGEELNLPTILSEAQPQQDQLPRTRKAGKGKQTTGQKGKKQRDDNPRLKQVVSQPPNPAQQTTWASQVSNSLESQLTHCDATILMSDPAMTPNAASIIQQAMNGPYDPNLCAIIEEQPCTGTFTIQFDALENEEHMAELTDLRGPDMNRMDSGLGGDSLSPTTQPQTLQWV